MYDSTALRRGGLEPAGTILRSIHPELVVSKQKLRRAEVIQLVREKRETANQTLGFASRPFVLCGLPVKRPRPDVLLHELYNGRDHSTVCFALKRVAALREDDPEVDCLVSALAAEIKTAELKESGRTDTRSQTPADGVDFRLSDAFLDALADRLALRIFERVKGIDANAARGLK